MLIEALLCYPNTYGHVSDAGSSNCRSRPKYLTQLLCDSYLYAFLRQSQLEDRLEHQLS